MTPQQQLPDRWSARMAAVSTPEAITALARQYVRDISAGELARLPRECLPPPMQVPQDVCAYAFTLTRVQLSFDGPLSVGALIDRFAAFFTAASSRIAHLEHIARAHV